MVKSLLLVSSVLLAGAAVASRPVEAHVHGLEPAQAAGGTNPVKPTAESRAKAKKMYGYDCALCHADSGDGKTDLGKDMQLTDLTDPKTLAGKSDQELFDLIRKGKDKMPPEEAARAKDDDVWNLVIYVRGLAKNSATATAAPPQ